MGKGRVLGKSGVEIRCQFIILARKDEPTPDYLSKSNPNYKDIYTAQLEAAQGRAELAQLELDRLTLRAPFAGRIISLPVSSGQYVLKGTEIAELADITSLKSLVPVDRRTVTERADLKVFVEEQEQTAKVQSILPLPESYASLRELAAPFTSAWVVVPNAKGELAPGLRVRSANLPITPIATVPKESLKTTEGSAGSAASMVQVLRNEYVTNVPVDVLGKMGPDRIQVTGALRAKDALIVSSSVPLLAGTLVRFAPPAVWLVTSPQTPGHVIEGMTPNPARQGVEAGIAPPGAAATEPAAGPSGSSRSRSASGRPARPTPAAAPAQGQGSPPF